MAIDRVRQKAVSLFRLALKLGMIGISAFSAMGAMTWAVDSAPLSNIDPMPLPLGGLAWSSIP